MTQIADHKVRQQLQPPATKSPAQCMIELLAKSSDLKEIFLSPQGQPNATSRIVNSRAFGLIPQSTSTVSSGQGAFVALTFAASSTALKILKEGLDVIWQQSNPRPHSVPERIVEHEFRDGYTNLTLSIPN